MPYPVLDANVRRVVMRLARMSGERNAKKDKLIMKRLQGWIPLKKPGLFNQAIMELGALVCRPHSPLCLLCPVSAFCRAYEAGDQEVIPKPKKKSATNVEAVVGIIRKDGRYLIQKRPSTGLLADLWEFPGGKKRTRGDPRTSPPPRTPGRTGGRYRGRTAAYLRPTRLYTVPRQVALL